MDIWNFHNITDEKNNSVFKNIITFENENEKYHYFLEFSMQKFHYCGRTHCRVVVQ